MRNQAALDKSGCQYAYIVGDFKSGCLIQESQPQSGHFLFTFTGFVNHFQGCKEIQP